MRGPGNSAECAQHWSLSLLQCKGGLRVLVALCLRKTKQKEEPQSSSGIVVGWGSQCRLGFYLDSKEEWPFDLWGSAEKSLPKKLEDTKHNNDLLDSTRGLKCWYRRAQTYCP